MKINVNYLLLFLMGGFLFFSIGCNTDQSAVPGYIKIDDFTVDSTSYDSTGSVAASIHFAWVYIDDNLQGVYQLPALFPVIGEGTKSFRIFAGVYEFGNGATATKYLFYDEWKTTANLITNSTVTLQPHVRYNIGLNIPYKEDFESMSSSTLEQAPGSTGDFQHHYTTEAFEGNGSAYLHLGTADPANSILIVQTISGNPIYVPKNLTGYFVELNYKSNTPFFLAMKTSQGSKNIVGFNTHNDWNKAYINITSAIDQLPGTDISFVWSVYRDISIPNQEVWIDNLKLVYSF